MPGTIICGPGRASRRPGRPLMSLAALGLVAGLAAGCGSASTPLEQYQNCIRCGYDFSQPIPTAAAALRRAGRPAPGVVAYGPNDLI